LGVTVSAKPGAESAGKEIPTPLQPPNVIAEQGTAPESGSGNSTGMFTPLVASCNITPLPNTNGTTFFERAPHAGYRFGRSVYLITAAEMASASYATGSIPTSIGFNYASAPGLA